MQAIPRVAIPVLIWAFWVGTPAALASSGKAIDNHVNAAPDTLPPLSDRWWSGFDRARGPNGFVDVLVPFESDLIVGGRFVRVGLLAANHIARWNGSSWSSLGDGLSGRTRDIVEHDGNLLATDVGRVRSWDGSRWIRLGPDAGSADQVLDLIVFRNQLLASYYTSGVRRWDGTQWITIGAVPTNSRVTALAVFGDRLLAAGSFDQIGGVAARNIASWDGVDWRPLAGGVWGEVRAMVVHGPNLVVSGLFTAVDGLPATGLATWNGSAWSALPDAWATVLFSDGTDLMGIRGARVVRWSGSSWVEVEPSLYPALPQCLTKFRGSFVAGAVYNGESPAETHDVAILDPPAGWRRVSHVEGAGLTFPVTEFAVHRDTLYAGQEGRDEQGNYREAFLQWSGTSWIEVACPVPIVRAITSYHGDLVVGGGPGQGNINIASRNEATWNILGGLLQDWGGELRGGTINALTVYRGDLVAGGVFSVSPTGQVLLNVARWDGLSWHSLAGGVPAGEAGISALLVHEDRLFATGRGAVITSWDGTEWTRLGTRDARGLQIFRNALYATSLDGQYPLVRWDGSNWRIIETPFGVGVATTVYQDRLVAGSFQWDGTTWARMYTGLSGGQTIPSQVLALLPFQGSLYAGGDFTLAGGKPSYYVARWDGGPTPVSIHDLSAFSGAEGVRLQWRLSAEAMRELALFRVQRAEVAAGPYVEMASTPLAPAREMTYLDASVEPGRHYWYRLILVTANGEEGTAGTVSIVATDASRLKTTLQPIPPLGAAPIEIRYVLGSSGAASLDLFDVRGRLVRRLDQGVHSAGEYVRIWSAQTDDGVPVSQGVYFVRLRSGAESHTRKLVLLHK